jgi:DNA-directed RNA polymerase specialized sigma subunit
MNPLDEYLAEQDEGQDKESAVRVNFIQPKFQQPQPIGVPELKAKQQAEIQMWQTWDQGGRKAKDLRPLVQSMRPLVQERVNVYSGRVPIPPEALEAEFKNHAVKAIKTYDPNRGAKLSTWVRSNIRKGGRFVSTYQNVGRVVEDRVSKITDYKLANEQLLEQTGRAPSDAEVAKKLGWSMPEVQRMNSELRADIMSSAFESDPTSYTPQVDNEIIEHLHEELSPQEQKVFRYMKTPGATQGKTGLIAKQLKWSPSKVSRLRKAIEAKATHYKNVLGK